jgi:methyl-accepting chemotaxis protein
LSEKYLKKLIGKTEIEDALKRLDKLTNEEVRMVTAQVLKTMHTVEDRVVRVDDRVTHVDERVARVDEGVARIDEGVARVDEGVTRVDEGVARIDGRVASMGDKVAHVDERVAGVEGRVASVDDKVKVIDDKVAVGIDGAQPSLISYHETVFNSDVLRGKRDEGSHTTSGRQHGSSQSFVIFFLR